MSLLVIFPSPHYLRLEVPSQAHTDIISVGHADLAGLLMTRVKPRENARNCEMIKPSKPLPVLFDILLT